MLFFGDTRIHIYFYVVVVVLYYIYTTTGEQQQKNVTFLVGMMDFPGLRGSSLTEMISRDDAR